MKKVLVNERHRRPASCRETKKSYVPGRPSREKTFPLCPSIRKVTSLTKSLTWDT